MAIYTIEKLTFKYPNEKKPILNGLDFEISQGEFIVFCGASGSGKTTFLKQLKTVLTPNGVTDGVVYYKASPLEEISLEEQAKNIGFVMQNPDNQLVTDKVWHELAFGLENLGVDNGEIRLRVSEMASFFGIQNWFHKGVNELSGGQKQLLNLASIMVMQPEVLILDEPTSQLDPIAAGDFLDTIEKINKEFGTTIIMTEHRLEQVFPMATRVLLMDKGEVILDGSPRFVGHKMSEMKHKMFLAMPVPMRIHSKIRNDLRCPITISEGRQWLDTIVSSKQIDFYSQGHNQEPESQVESKNNKLDEYVIEGKNLWFKYEEDQEDVVKGASFKVRRGELYSILGGNGTGKSTTLSLISGLNKPYRGSLKIKGRNMLDLSYEDRYSGLFGILPQDPQSLFLKKTVSMDLLEVIRDWKVSEEEIKFKVGNVVDICQLTGLLDRHPYDLSGGEQQKLALAKILLVDPEILLLDEPTKGLDAEFKLEFAKILKFLLKQGKTIVMISHDIEFCARYSDRCSLFFDGAITTTNNSREFFAGNSFYTTSTNRMARHLFKNPVIIDDLIIGLGGDVEEEKELDFKNQSEVNDLSFTKTYKKKDYKRYMTMTASIFLCIYSFIKGLLPNLSKIIENPKNFSWTHNQFDLNTSSLFLVFIFSLSYIFIETFPKKNSINVKNLQVDKWNRSLSKRTRMAMFSSLILIPITIFIGVYYLEDRKYYFISLLVMLEVMLPFFKVFEDRKPQARELVIIAVLCAMGIAGRAAFFMIPQFKPIAAIVIISGLAFGGEAGFLVGALTMLLSNIMYGQGPWTPWQMFAMGLIGFLAGILYRKGILRKEKISLSIFGGLVVFFIYGGIMNPASLLIYHSDINLKMVIAAYMTGIPFDFIHAISTVFFIIFMGEPMLEKLDRIKIKYGLIE